MKLPVPGKSKQPQYRPPDVQPPPPTVIVQKDDTEIRRLQKELQLSNEERDKIHDQYDDEHEHVAHLENKRKHDKEQFDLREAQLQQFVHDREAWHAKDKKRKIQEIINKSAKETSQMIKEEKEKTAKLLTSKFEAEAKVAAEKNKAESDKMKASAASS